MWRLREARRHLRAAIAFAQRHEIDFYRHYAVAWLALCELHLGQWDDAHEHALDIVAQPTPPTTSRVMALAALGRLQARRGEPEAARTLDEALALALASGTLQRIAPVRCARAEAAWLRGDLPATIAEAEAALALAESHRHAWFAGELAQWVRRAGAAAVVPAACAEPHALLLHGHWQAAADAWAALGCPFEQALALAEGDDAARLAALALFDDLGAQAAAERLRKTLRAAGLRGIPRGARATTQTNPHQLTERETRGAGAAVRRPEELRDRRAPVPLGAHRRSPRGRHVRQAGRGHARRGRRGRGRAGISAQNGQPRRAIRAGSPSRPNAPSP